MCPLYASTLARTSGGPALTTWVRPRPQGPEWVYGTKLLTALTPHLTLFHGKTIHFYCLYSLVNCCSFLLQHPSPTLVNIAPFRQTWKSLSSPSQMPSNSGGKPLQILDVSTRQENEVRFYSIWSSRTIGYFYQMWNDIMHFFPYSFPLGKTIWYLPNTLNYNVFVGNSRYDKANTSGVYSHWKESSLLTVPKRRGHAMPWGRGHQGRSAGRGGAGTVSRVFTVVSAGANKWGGISRLRN